MWRVVIKYPNTVDVSELLFSIRWNPIMHENTWNSNVLPNQGNYRAGSSSRRWEGKRSVYYVRSGMVVFDKETSKGTGTKIYVPHRPAGPSARPEDSRVKQKELNFGPPQAEILGNLEFQNIDFIRKSSINKLGNKIFEIQKNIIWKTINFSSFWGFRFQVGSCCKFRTFLAGFRCSGRRFFSLIVNALTEQ